MGTIAFEGVTKRFGDVVALDGVDLSVQRGRVTGLVGRNGAGKSTLLDLIAGQTRPTSGAVRVLGEDPFENRGVLRDVCAITEDQRYPTRFSVEAVLSSARLLHPRWDEELARQLVDVFRLRRRQKIGRLSRGQRSALGIVIGICSGASITVLDEPYVGLDAVARRQFYDLLLAHLVSASRTVLLSSHLIDEVDHLLEHLVVIDNGRILLDAEVEGLRHSVLELTGPRMMVDAYARSVEVLGRSDLGGVSRATVRGASRSEASAVGLHVRSLSLQEVVVAIAAVSSSGAPESAMAAAS